MIKEAFIWFLCASVLVSMQLAAGTEGYSVDRTGYQTAASDFTDIAAACPDIILDIRYATENNFLGYAVYPEAACFLRSEVALALFEVQRELATQGLGLKVYDGYRPLSAQQIMWDLIQDERYVSNPATNQGRHTRGTTVDLTLVDLEGNELPMPTPFDDFTEVAGSNYPYLSDEILRNRSLLQEVMQRHGFELLSSEWWHFDFHGWRDDRYPALDISFAELSQLIAS